MWKLSGGSNTTSSVCLNKGLRHPGGKQNRKPGMRGIWAKSLMLPGLPQPVKSSGTDSEALLQAAGKEGKEGEGAGNPRREAAALRSTYGQQWNHRLEQRCSQKGKNTNSKFRLQNPTSLQMTPLLGAAFSLRNRKSDTNCWTVIFKSSSFHMRESLASPSIPGFQLGKSERLST